MARQHEPDEPPGDKTSPKQQDDEDAAGPGINAPLPRKNTPPCTSKGTAEVCPEEQAPFSTVGELCELFSDRNSTDSAAS